VRWGTFGLGALFLICAGLLSLNTLRTEGQDLHVFGTFWSSGWAASHQLNPYAVYPFTVRFEDTFYTHRSFASLNLTPPCLLPIFQGIAAFNPDKGVRVWTFLSVLLFIGSVALLLREYGETVQRRQIIWYFFGPTALGTLLSGQDYSLLVLLGVLTWISMEQRRELAAGVFLGILVAIKPNLGLWPIFLALCGHRQMAKTSAATLLIVCTIPVLLYGPHIYAEWLHVVSNDPHWISFLDVSVTGFASRLGHRTMGRVLSLVLLMGAIAFVAWKRPSAKTATGIALCLGLLASPLGWIGYSLFLTPVLFSKPWSTRLSLIILPLMLPFALAAKIVRPSLLTIGIAGLFYFLPMCFLLAYYLRTAAAESRARPRPVSLDAKIGTATA
jgi:hypothetical protein